MIKFSENKMPKLIKRKIVHDVKEFTINRAKWGRGDSNEGYLLNDVSGKMCCLGFYAKACGLKNKDIIGVTDPASYQSYFFEKNSGTWKTKLLKSSRNTSTCNDLIIINDSMYITDEAREEKIIKKFARIGIKVKFVGKK